MTMNSDASCFVENTVKMYLHLPPCFANDVQNGIRQKLDRFLLKYVAAVRGVVVSYSDIKLLQEKGRIMYDSPYLHFWISVKLMSFSPVVGSRLLGSVNKQSSDHIGLLVYGIFNASISAAEISDRFSWNEHEQAWVSSGSGEVVENECELVFTISKNVVENGMLSLRGSLIDSSTGFHDGSPLTQNAILSLPETSAAAPESAAAERKKKRKKSDAADLAKKPSKKKKKERESMPGDLTSSEHRSKKDKKRKSLEAKAALELVGK